MQADSTNEAKTDAVKNNSDTSANSNTTGVIGVPPNMLHYPADQARRQKPSKK